MTINQSLETGFPEIFHKWTSLTELIVAENRIADLQLQFEVRHFSYVSTESLPLHIVESFPLVQ